MNVWNPHERHTCHDCNCLEGELHERGCDMERCPFCLGQLISCGCCYKPFYPAYDDSYVKDAAAPGGWRHKLPMCGLPEAVYKGGLPDDQAAEWERLLAGRGRVPYMVAPNLCARCGETWPDMFLADDWHDVIPASLRGEMLCSPCYETVKRFVLLGRTTTQP